MPKISRLGELRRLSAGEWALAFDAVLLLPVASTALSVGGLPWTCAVVDRWPMLSARFGPTLTPHRAGRLIAAAASAYGTRCLPSAIVVHAILRRFGVRCDLVLGAAGFGSQFRAHAWVEREGTTIAGQSSEGYQPLHRLARTAAWSRAR